MSIQLVRAKDGPFGINNHELMHALINIFEEFHRQGVRRVVFGSLYPRHHSGPIGGTTRDATGSTSC